MGKPLLKKLEITTNEKLSRWPPRYRRETLAWLLAGSIQCLVKERWGNCWHLVYYHQIMLMRSEKLFCRCTS